MSSFLKKRLAVDVLITASGLISFVLIIIKGSLGDKFSDYIRYVAIGFCIVGITRLIKSVPAIRDKTKAEMLESNHNDEMFKQIDHNSVYISFIIILIAETLGIGILYFLGKVILATYLSIVLFIQSVIYLTVYIIVKNKYWN